MNSSNLSESQRPLIDDKGPNYDEERPAYTLGSGSDGTSESSQPQNENGRKDETMGYVFMFVGALFVSFHILFIRISESYYHIPFSINLICRGVIHFTFSILYYTFFTSSTISLVTSLKKRQIILLAIRGFVGSIALVLFYFSVNLIPIGQAIAIFFLSPIFTLILTHIFLHEPIYQSDIFAVILSLSGAFLITISSSDEQQDVSTNMRVLGSILVACCAFLASIVFTIIRYLGMSIDFMLSTLSHSSFCIGATFLIGGYSELYRLIMDPEQHMVLFLMVIAAVCSFIAQCGANLGLQRARAGPAILIGNIEVPIAFALGYIFLNEKPSFLTIIGSTCVVCAALLIGVMQLIRR